MGLKWELFRATNGSKLNKHDFLYLYMLVEVSGPSNLLHLPRKRSPFGHLAKDSGLPKVSVASPPDIRLNVTVSTIVRQ